MQSGWRNPLFFPTVYEQRQKAVTEKIGKTEEGKKSIRITVTPTI